MLLDATKGLEDLEVSILECSLAIDDEKKIAKFF